MTSIRRKYSYEEYNNNYVSLYDEESEKIKSYLSKIKFHIYHFGSTSIPGVGGKGVIDIYISSSLDDIDSISDKLLNNGYEFRKSGGDKDTKFYQREFEDRRYHVHLTSFNNKRLIEAIAFRDFLTENPLVAQQYSLIKKEASTSALKMHTKEEMKKVYMMTKTPFFEKVRRDLEAYIMLNKDKYINI